MEIANRGAPGSHCVRQIHLPRGGWKITSALNNNLLTKLSNPIKKASKYYIDDLLDLLSLLAMRLGCGATKQYENSIQRVL